MAIGFALSTVIGIEIDEAEDAIYFDLRAVRYKILLDDHARAKELAELLTKHVNKVPPATKKKKPLPDFYVEKTKENGGTI
jgi:hypothetical protein